MKSASQTPFDFQDLFPLVAGDYNLSVLIKNEVSKEFTSVEQTLRIPEAGAAVALTRPLLGYRAVKLDPAAAVKVKAFRLGQYQIYGQPGRVFTKQDTMVLAFQVNDATEAVRAGGELHIEFLKDGQPLRDIRRKHIDYADPRNILEEVPLADFAPAHYTVRVSYLSGGMELVSTSEEFDLTFAESVPRPWLSSRLLPDAGDPAYQVMLGSQLFNLGRAAEARVFLERAFARTRPRRRPRPAWPGSLSPLETPPRPPGPWPPSSTRNGRRSTKRSFLPPRPRRGLRSSRRPRGSSIGPSPITASMWCSSTPLGNATRALGSPGRPWRPTRSRSSSARTSRRSGREWRR